MESQHYLGHQHPLIFNEKQMSNQSEAEAAAIKCSRCGEAMFGPSFSCAEECGFYVHKQCAEAPSEMNHPFHRDHPLCLLPNSPYEGGYICNFCGEEACLSSPLIIQDKHHPHPFTRFWRNFSFTCDACGIDKKGGFRYTCSKCKLLVHKECISLPRVIKFFWHEHPIFHNYFLQLQGEGSSSKSWECVVCLDKVDIGFGSYSCLHCHFIVHVKCARKNEKWFYEIEPEDYKDDNFSDSDACKDSMIVMDRNEDGEATRIKHFSHEHNLMLSDEKINVEDHQYCDGCALSVSLDHPFYYCSQCDFLLHKKCAEFPIRKHLWFHVCPHPTTLVSEKIFKCFGCRYVYNGFAYRFNNEEWFDICLPCVIPDIVKCQGHEHPLYYHFGYDEGNCNACGKKIAYPFKCKVCKFFVHGHCLKLPQKAPHKCDEYLLTLTYHDDNTYSLTHFCDICEQDRDPSLWFYHCAICDISAHLNCVLGKGRYPFMKPGKIYKESDQLHPHPLIFVKKIHYYPECFKCGDSCQNLALECVNSECSYIVHWDCIAPSNLKES
ncbi:Zinc finger, PHD-type [Corchorus olitorius]|uniref:Zinc finger, PHD-type n=1 Tax=Corchorus olitorius TaxID=93759 RepID=A0A1R3JGM3_9ROSI|nr:Zinc finger, PHD-type [Corchorus olitorius]